LDAQDEEERKESAPIEEQGHFWGGLIARPTDWLTAGDEIFDEENAFFAWGKGQTKTPTTTKGTYFWEEVKLKYFIVVFVAK
jgi:hypothetical protein